MIPNQAIDIYAHTNPAFGGLVFYQYTIGFVGLSTKNLKKMNSPTYPHYYFTLPILYSQKGKKSFEGTNHATGFLNWLERCPELRIGFAAEVHASRHFCESALLFAVTHHLLDTDGWHYWPIDNPPWSLPKWKVNTDERGKMLSNAKYLGAWMAKINLPDIFLALGVRP